MYYTAVNSFRVDWKLQNGTTISTSAFGAVNLTTGDILWETPVPANGSSLVPPTVVNGVVMTGRGGPYGGPKGKLGVGPGNLIALDKHTGSILKNWPLAAYTQGGIAVVDDYVMFGTGYTTVAGSFNVWKLE